MKGTVAFQPGLLMVAATLSACAIPLTDYQRDAALQSVRMATTAEPSDLLARAEAGDATSQHALSIVLRYGLNGERPDPEQAAYWRRQAAAARGTMPITQYTPAFGGAPSRVNILHVPRYAITEPELAIAEACAAALSEKRGDEVCGDAETAAELARNWAGAARR